MFLNKRFLKNYFKITFGYFFNDVGLTKKFIPEKRFWELVYKNFPHGDAFNFIQVGANDGASFDILFDLVKIRKSSGIVIEPLIDFFKELCETYKDFPEIIKVNKAVHPTNRTVKIYRVDPQLQHLAPDWARGIGSLDPEHHKKSETPSEIILSETVEAAPLMQIIGENNFMKDVDLLQIDVEGFDFEVLKMIDFKKIKPGVIKYEITNLSEIDKKASVRLLKQNGYYLFLIDDDMVGILLNKISL